MEVKSDLSLNALLLISIDARSCFIPLDREVESRSAKQANTRNVNVFDSRKLRKMYSSIGYASVPTTLAALLITILPRSGGHRQENLFALVEQRLIHIIFGVDGELSAALQDNECNESKQCTSSSDIQNN